MQVSSIVIRSNAMRAVSSAASLTVHIALGAAVVLGSANAGRSSPTRPGQVTIVFPPNVSTGQQSGVGAPNVQLPALDLPLIPVPAPVLQSGAPAHPSFPVNSPATLASGTGQGEAWFTPLDQEGPEVLAGPIPTYPELLRQAGIQGRVLLEAVVDTTGRVHVDSISVISATNPAFVTAARQALLATLFRPARIGGRAVRMRVRVPFEFAIRGSGRAH
jgi:protein TonB